MELETELDTGRERDVDEPAESSATSAAASVSSSRSTSSGFVSSLPSSIPTLPLAASSPSFSSTTAVSSSAPAAAASPPSPVPAVELSALFEARRPVRRLLPPSHTVSIPIRLLNAELTCVVCLGILRQCTSVMSCLHRFCSACIQKSLRFGKKECPQCRVSCPSHRHLRPDPVFDSIIAAIYPDLEQAEEAQSRQLQSMIDRANVTQFAESAMRGARKQAEQAQQRAADSRRQQEQSRREAQERRRRLESTAYFRLLPLPPLTHAAPAPAAASASASASPPPLLVLAKDRFKSNKAVDIRMLRLFIPRRLQVQHAAQAMLTAEMQQQQAAVSCGPSVAAAAVSPCPLPFPRVRVSVWLRWSDLTDLARRVWLKRRTQRRQSAESAAATAAAAAEPAAEAAGEDHVNASRKRRRDESEGEDEESSRGIVGFVCSEQSDRPDFVQLGGFSTLSFIYDRVWDEKRAAAQPPAAAAARAGGDAEPHQQQALWRKLTLYYALQEMDQRPLRRQSRAEDDPTQLQQPQLTEPAMHPQPTPSPLLQPQLPTLSVDAADTLHDGV